MGNGFERLRIRGGVASMVVDRASPVFSADEDVHNPSVDGLGTSWGVGASTVGNRRSYAWLATEHGKYAKKMHPSAKRSWTAIRIGADVSRRRKQKALSFVVTTD